MIPRPALLLLSFLITGCSGSRVAVQSTPGADFGRYETYAIRPGNVVYPGASEAQRTAIEQRVQDAVAIELEGRGVVPQPDEPALIVTYTIGAQPGELGGAGSARSPVGVDARGAGGNPYDEPGLVRPRELPDAAADAELRRGNVQGDLVIDLLDGRTRRLVWRATASLELSPLRAPRAIDAAVGQAFAKLPLARRPMAAPSVSATTAPSETAPQ